MVSPKEAGDEAIVRYNRWIMIFTGALALVAFIQIAFLIDANRVASEAAKAAQEAAEATTRSVVLAEKTAERQLRAYINVKGIEMKERPADGVWRAEVEFVNFGETPAYDVRAWIRWESTDDPNFNKFVDGPPDGIDVPTDMGPGVLMRLDAKPNRSFTADEIAGFDSGKYSIYVYGHILYWDTFRKEERKTRLKFSPPKWFVPTPEGNTSN